MTEAIDGVIVNDVPLNLLTPKERTKLRRQSDWIAISVHEIMSTKFVDLSDSRTMNSSPSAENLAIDAEIMKILREKGTIG